MKERNIWQKCHICFVGNLGKTRMNCVQIEIKQLILFRNYFLVWLFPGHIAIFDFVKLFFFVVFIERESQSECSKFDQNDCNASMYLCADILMVKKISLVWFNSLYWLLDFHKILIFYCSIPNRSYKTGSNQFFIVFFCTFDIFLF